ncbi:precorrin-3B C(17)-methyltransferase [Halobacteriales archaeon QH_6_64_20]|nr:MAG: precorrin-3B C(17)-methyltransferase [Halobacteriales archaeon QH_6_64_20]
METSSETTTERERRCGASTETTADGGTASASSTTSADETQSRCESSPSSGVESSTSSYSGSSCGASKREATDEKVGSTADDFDADPGSLTAVGLGPGQPEGMTERARAALLEAEHIVGYTTYIDLLPDDSGDPNVYALSGLALEIIESKGATAETLDFEVVPGVPAAQSCGARLGAPLVNDTVSVSLSDHLTPMDEIESRLHAVAGEGFTISIYNPWSRKRRENFRKCCEILLEYRDPDTPVGIVHGAGREDERSEIVDLGDLEELGETDLIDMTTTILVGNEETYVWDNRMVTPRGYESKYEY